MTEANMLLSVIVDGLWRRATRASPSGWWLKTVKRCRTWQPGAHIDVHLPCGVVRQYSLTGPCGDEAILFAWGETASRGGSRYIHETLRPGQKLLISPPRNLFPLQQAERVLLLAAGIGITPLYAMALQLKAAGTPFTLHYYVKTVKARRLPRALAFIAVSAHSPTSPRTALAGSPAPDAGFTPTPADRRVYGKVREVATANGWDDAHFTARRFSPLRPRWR
jgi:vanillate O-demethylase ferredoxin subunit